MDSQFITRGLYSNLTDRTNKNSTRNAVNVQDNIHAYRAKGMNFSSILRKNIEEDILQENGIVEKKEVVSNGKQLLSELSQLVNISNKFVTQALTNSI